MKKKESQAFSIIEMSIVLLVIGIIVTGIIGGRKLVNMSNLTKARALTYSSPVTAIKDLVLWVETTSKNSFTSVPTSGTSILTWKDINPQKTDKQDLTTGDAPTYIENAINGLPALRFNGTANYLQKTSTSINTGTELTVFAVLRRIAALSDFQIWLSMWQTGQAADNNNSASIGFDNGVTGTPIIRYYRNNADNNATHPALGTPFIYSTVFNGTNNYSFVNGAVSNFTNPTANASTTGNFNIQNIYVGAGRLTSIPTRFWNGDIGEIIVYDRAISDFERQQIEQYLAKKWGIKLS